MKHTDYIIVGDGYAALFFAHQLIMHNKNFVLFSEGKESASQLSAGIINPVVLKRFSSFWLAQEQISFLHQTLEEMQTYTGNNYFINEPVVRLLHDEVEKELWKKKSTNRELIHFLDPNFLNLDLVVNPFGAGIVKQSGRLDVQRFFSDFFHYLHAKGHLIKEKFDYSLVQTSECLYKDIKYKNIVFCEGMSALKNPFFSSIPLIPNKGHQLKVQLSKDLSSKFTIKKKHFLFPLQDGCYFYGGTYDRDQLHHEIDETAKQQLIEGIEEFYPYDFQVKEVNYGFRPTVYDRRPILGNNKEYRNLYIFNGIGARGILNGSYFAKSLFNFIEYQEPLLPEVDFKRFEKK